jgi:hypothetical protein
MSNLDQALYNITHADEVVFQLDGKPLKRKNSVVSKTIDCCRVVMVRVGGYPGGTLLVNIITKPSKRTYRYTHVTYKA